MLVTEQIGYNVRVGFDGQDLVLTNNSYTETIVLSPEAMLNLLEYPFSVQMMEDPLVPTKLNEDVSAQFNGDEIILYYTKTNSTLNIDCYTFECFIEYFEALNERQKFDVEELN